MITDFKVREQLLRCIASGKSITNLKTVGFQKEISDKKINKKIINSRSDR